MEFILDINSNSIYISSLQRFFLNIRLLHTDTKLSLDKYYTGKLFHYPIEYFPDATLYLIRSSYRKWTIGLSGIIEASW